MEAYKVGAVKKVSGPVVVGEGMAGARHLPGAALALCAAARCRCRVARSRRVASGSCVCGRQQLVSCARVGGS
jgi:hypothetical protein